MLVEQFTRFTLTDELIRRAMTPPAYSFRVVRNIMRYGFTRREAQNYIFEKVDKRIVKLNQFRKLEWKGEPYEP